MVKAKRKGWARDFFFFPVALLSFAKKDKEHRFATLVIIHGWESGH